MAENEEGLEEGVDNQTRWLRRGFAESQAGRADDELKELLDAADQLHRAQNQVEG